MRRVLSFAAVIAMIVTPAACSSSSSHNAATAANGDSNGTTTVTAAATGAPRPSPGCAKTSGAAVETERRTISVGGQERFYYLTVPGTAGTHQPMPLVLDFHGLAEGAQVHTMMSNFGALADKDGFVVAFPNGTGQPVKWDLTAPPAPNPDLKFVDQLLTTLESQYCIDTSRVYASGLSFGAFMSSFLACARSDTFAAVAPVAGITIYPDCTPTRPMPVIAFHGTADPILHFNGGVGAIPGITGPASTAAGATTTTVPADLNGKGYPAAVAQWAKRNGCDPTATDTRLTKEVIHRVYHCPAGADVEFYIVIGGGHAWPGSEFSRKVANIVGYTTFDVDATKVIWDFFKRFQLPSR